MKIISSLIYLGGQAHPPPPPTGHNKTNKLRRSIKELGGGSTSLTPPPPRQFALCVLYSFRTFTGSPSCWAAL